MIMASPDRLHTLTEVLAHYPGKFAVITRRYTDSVIAGSVQPRPDTMGLLYQTDFKLFDKNGKPLMLRNPYQATYALRYGATINRDYGTFRALSSFYRHMLYTHLISGPERLISEMVELTKQAYVTYYLTLPDEVYSVETCYHHLVPTNF